MATFSTIYKEAARNLNMLSSDETTVIPNGRLTLTGIKNRINLIYQDKVINYLTRKFPRNFEQPTYPQQTYRTSFVVSNSSTGTTLISNTPIFNNSDEGFTVQFVSGSTFSGPNATAATGQVKILQWTNNTTVITDSAVDSYKGLTGFILGNEIELNGDASNAKEILDVYYQAVPNGIYLPCTLRQKSDLPPIWIPAFGQGHPVWYQTTNLVNRVPVNTIGLLPFPTDYRGSFRINYVRRVSPMVNDYDVPQLEITGLSDVLINGTTAWGLRLLGDKGASEYEEQDDTGSRSPLGLKATLKNYIPVNRSQSSRLRMGGVYSAMQRRSI